LLHISNDRTAVPPKRPENAEFPNLTPSLRDICSELGAISLCDVTWQQIRNML
jgi:hypothetical protein